jgi:hypothetical protein
MQTDLLLINAYSARNQSLMPALPGSVQPMKLVSATYQYLNCP